MPPTSLTTSPSLTSCNGSSIRNDIDTGSTNKYWDKNACEDGYNETASLAATNMLKSRGPFQITVETRKDLSFLSIYFSGCDKVFRQGLQMEKNLFNLHIICWYNDSLF
jgi:hypothetical protein